MIFTADYLVTITQAIVRQGAVLVKNGIIVDCGELNQLRVKFPREEIREFPGQVLLPGFINAHAHLELSSARYLGLDSKWPRPSFTQWVRQLQVEMQGWDQSQWMMGLQQGISDILRTGTTTVVDHSSGPYVLQALQQSGLRVYAQRELIGLNPDLAQQRYFECQKQCDNQGGCNEVADPLPRFHSQLTPHAAYSCSPELLKLWYSHFNTKQAKKHRSSGNLPSQTFSESGSPPPSIHIAESIEEVDLFKQGQGPLAQFCREKYPLWKKPESTHPLDFMWDQGVWVPGTWVIHGNILEEKHLIRLCKEKAALVYCPGSHSYFGHPEFDVKKILSYSLPVLVGTDSLASNTSLSLWDEMKLVYDKHGLNPLHILKMVTSFAGLALGDSRLGQIVPGAIADIQAVYIKPSSLDSLYLELVQEGTEASFVMVQGEVLFDGQGG